MNCIHCEEEGFNRIILDGEKHRMMGALCEECEGKLRVGELRSADLVPELKHTEIAEPRFALPVLDLVATDAEEGEFYLEYTMDSSTPYLTEIEKQDSETLLMKEGRLSG